MKIVCPECLRVVDGQDIDFPARTALCRPCSHVFDLTKALGATKAPILGLLDEQSGRSRRFVLPYAIPLGRLFLGLSVGVSSAWLFFACLDGGDMRLRYPYLDRGLPVPVTVPERFSRSWFSSLPMDYHLSLLGLLLLVVASLVVLAAALRNRVSLSLDPDHFVLREAPMRWFGRRQVPTREIAEFVVHEVSGATGIARPVWELQIHKQDGSTLRTRLRRTFAADLPCLETVASGLNATLASYQHSGSYRDAPGLRVAVRDAIEGSESDFEARPESSKAASLRR